MRSILPQMQVKYIKRHQLPSPEIIMKAKNSIINAFLDSVAWEAIKQKWIEIKRVEQITTKATYLNIA